MRFHDGYSRDSRSCFSEEATVSARLARAVTLFLEVFREKSTVYARFSRDNSLSFGDEAIVSARFSPDNRFCFVWFFAKSYCFPRNFVVTTTSIFTRSSRRSYCFRENFSLQPLLFLQGCFCYFRKEPIFSTKLAFLSEEHCFLSRGTCLSVPITHLFCGVLAFSHGTCFSTRNMLCFVRTSLF